MVRNRNPNPSSIHQSIVLELAQLQPSSNLVKYRPGLSQQRDEKWMSIKEHWALPPALSPDCLPRQCLFSANIFHLQYWLVYQAAGISISLSWIVIQQKIKCRCLFLVIFSLHITTLSIKFQCCTFNLENSEDLSSSSGWFRPYLPCTVPRYHYLHLGFEMVPEPVVLFTCRFLFLSIPRLTAKEGFRRRKSKQEKKALNNWQVSVCKDLGTKPEVHITSGSCILLTRCVMNVP